MGQATEEKTSCHLVRIVATRFLAVMFFSRFALPWLLVLASAASVAAQDLGPFGGTPENARRYTECMALARKEPLRAQPIAEKWMGNGGGLGARHCVAVAMFEAGRTTQAAVQFESIARDLGQERPDLRAELWAQAGQAWADTGDGAKAAAAQTRAIDLKPNDPDLWIDRGLTYAGLSEWPRAVSDFDRALALRRNDVEILVLRAAAWRNSGDPARAIADAQLALKIAPDNTEALLERGYALLARGDRSAAQADFAKVLSLVPPGTNSAKRAEAGMQGGSPPKTSPIPGNSTPSKR